MGSEAAFRKRLSNQLRGIGADVCNHEDAVNEGVPDMSWGYLGVSGWMELKHDDKWPAYPGTVMRSKRYTERQRLWLYNRGEAGGRCFLFWQIGTDYLLFGHNAAQLAGKVPANLLRALALKTWCGGYSTVELGETLVGGSDDVDIVKEVML